MIWPLMWRAATYDIWPSPVTYTFILVCQIAADEILEVEDRASRQQVSTPLLNQGSRLACATQKLEHVAAASQALLVFGFTDSADLCARRPALQTLPMLT